MNEGKIVKNSNFIRKCRKNFVYLYDSQIFKIMDIKKESGIYCIQNTINNKVYIGQSKNIYRRFIHHKSMLNRNLHNNPYLQNAWNKYGEDKFIFEVLEYCDFENLTEKEKYYLSDKKEYYNLKDVFEKYNHPKRKYSKEAADKISNSLKGKIPKNLKNIQKLRRRKIAYYLNNKLIKIFISCTECANYFKIKPKAFNRYIGVITKHKSKYFPKGYKFEYYE